MEPIGHTKKRRSLFGPPPPTTDSPTLRTEDAEPPSKRHKKEISGSVDSALTSNATAVERIATPADLPLNSEATSAVSPSVSEDSSAGASAEDVERQTPSFELVPTAVSPIITTGFMSLPTEMRCIIYKQAALCRDGPISAWRGLYLLCRDIRIEMEQECTNVMKKYLEKLNTALANYDSTFGRGISIIIPESPTFSNIRRVVVEIPAKALMRNGYRNSRRTKEMVFPNKLKPLMDLHLDSLTFILNRTKGVEDPEAATRDPGRIQEKQARFIASRVRSQHIKAHKITVQMKSYPGDYEWDWDDRDRGSDFELMFGVVRGEIGKINFQPRNQSLGAYIPRINWEDMEGVRVLTFPIHEWRVTMTQSYTLDPEKPIRERFQESSMAWTWTSTRDNGLVVAPWFMDIAEEKCRDLCREKFGDDSTGPPPKRPQRPKRKKWGYC